MDVYSPSRIVFPHIMKTGGTTVNNFLHNFYHEDDVLFDASTIEEMNKMTFGKINSAKFIRGHFQASIVEFLGPDTEFELLGLLRDPVSRTVSHYWHMMRAPDIDPYFNFMREEKFTLEDYVNSEKCQVISSNYQVRNYGSGGDYRSGNEINDATLARAKEYIDRCAVVGVTEELHGFIDNLADHFGLPHIPATLDKTRSYSSGGELDSDLVAKIEGLNPLDRELYEYGLEKIAQQKIAPRKKINPVAIDASGRARWHATEPFSGIGWSDIMRTKVRHRWSLHNTAQFNVARNYSGSMMGYLSVLRFVSDDQERDLKLFVDDVEVPLHRSPYDGPDGRVLFFHVPKSSKAEIELRFELENMLAFTDVNPESDDNTKRGVALAGLAFSPWEPSRSPGIRGILAR